MGVRAAARRYSSRIIKAGALLTDSRAFLSAYDPKFSVQENLERILRRNILAKVSRARLKDILPIFRQRFLARPALAQALHDLAQSEVPPSILDRILYYHAAKADGLIYEFVTDFVYKKRQAGEAVVSPEEAWRFVSSLARSADLHWSTYTVRRVTRGLLATLRDFRLLEGAARKRIAPTYVPLETFIYVVFSLHLEGHSGQRLVQDGGWKLFLVTRGEVEALFLEAHRLKWLDYQVAGQLVRIELRLATSEDLVRAISSGSH